MARWCISAIVAVLLLVIAPRAEREVLASARNSPPLDRVGTAGFRDPASSAALGLSGAPNPVSPGGAALREVKHASRSTERHARSEFTTVVVQPAPSVGTVAALEGVPRSDSPIEPYMPERWGVIRKQVSVYAAPERRSRKLGYLRLGAVVQRGEAAGDGKGCADGWFRVAPQGFVCKADGLTSDLNHRVLTLARRRPQRDNPLPYRYARPRTQSVPRYRRFPSLEEQRQYEGNWVSASPFSHALKAWSKVRSEPAPAWLSEGHALPSEHGYFPSQASTFSGYALTRSAFAFLSFFDWGGRRYGLTTALELLPLDRLEPIQPSQFVGIELSEHTTLPVVFVRSKRAAAYLGQPGASGFRVQRSLEYREAVPITKERRRLGAMTYLKTQAGGWVVDHGLVHVEPVRELPPGIEPGQKWIDVSIERQVLVAYEGLTPRYVTLVSTGKDGLGDPETTHSTPRGLFVVHTKHVSASMTGEEVGDEYDLSDVPYVQYFHKGYALHAAYWHDAFGTPRSHGCVNLSPWDARWLFHWTAPAVPQSFHGAMSVSDGTPIRIRP